MAHQFYEHILDSRPDRSERHTAESPRGGLADEASGVEPLARDQVVRLAEGVTLLHVGMAARFEQQAVHIVARKRVERLVEPPDDTLRRVDGQDLPAIAQRM